MNLSERTPSPKGRFELLIGIMSLAALSFSTYQALRKRALKRIPPKKKTFDRVDLASDGSFPASDPPSH